MDDETGMDQVLPLAAQALTSRVWTLTLDGSSPTPHVRVEEGCDLVLGESDDADVVVYGASSHHARLRVEEGRLHVYGADVGSRVTVACGAEASSVRFSEAGSFVVGRSLVLCAPGRDEARAVRERPLEGVIGSSAAMRRLAREVREIARLGVPVVLEGETGAGKDVVAAALHRESGRKGAFLPINVATLGRDLAESELFGHERGAYTGADRGKPGAFVAADGGTLFLDEIGELEPTLQAKLLRTLESGEVRAVGSSTTREVDARIVAASWRSLEDLVQAGHFRDDLWHRLAVFTLRVPPLRERLEDLPELCEHFLGRLVSSVGRRRMTPGALAYLAQHAFPGNVRELRNVLTRAAAFAKGELIQVEEVTRALPLRAPLVRKHATCDRRTEVLQAVEAARGNVSAAARSLGVARSTVRFWLRRDAAETPAA